jgi:carbamoyl-phosphate synthase/aspartate carbamoyltransferase/dihydroorotase
MSLNQDISELVNGLTSDPATWIGQSIISVRQLASSGLELLMKTTDEMRELVKTKGGDERLKHRILSTVFYEASTRTSCSFQTAMLRLGGTVMHVDASSSGNTSAKKGETVYDTIRCLQSYTDVTVMRHPVKGTVLDALKGGLFKPLINAGDGVGEHPTQALLDLFTIIDELQMMKDKNNDTDRVEPLIVVLLGDLKHGRTVHSLAQLLARAQTRFLKRPLVLRFCSPDSLKMPDYIKDYIEKCALEPGSNITHLDFSSVKDAMLNANILYATRVQKERFEDINEYNKVAGAYVVNRELMKDAPMNMIVMHPLPRVDEISTDFDNDPRAAYFRQMENGLYVRMALLALVLGKS